MNPRVYVLLDIMPGKPEEVVRSLRGKPGVIRADLLDGPPDIAVIFEALNSLELARVTIETLNAYEPVTENVSFLPVRGPVGNADVGEITPGQMKCKRGTADARRKAHCYPC